MDVIEYTPSREQYAYTFGGVASAMRIKAWHHAPALVGGRVQWGAAQRR
jgi:hypothetical protein